MSGFADVYQHLCERYPDERDRGRAFEPLVTKVLRSDPLYRAHFAEVWPWNEWPGRDGGDIGIDIVARRHDGGLAAIQCKCQDRIDKHHIDSFLSESQRRLLGEPYVERYIFTTATEWSDNAERAISRIDPPVQRVDFFGLDGATIDWSAYLQDESAPLSAHPRKQLRPHQVRAVRDVLAGFEANDRGKLIMACGTGKTFTALRIAEQVAGLGGRVLFAAPSLSLLAQSMREWGADAETFLRAFAVCSDAKVGRNDGDSTRVYDMPIPATTNAEALFSAAKSDASGQMTVVFTTYQSMQVVADAHKLGLPEFDLVVCDEAHRTTGALRAEEGSSFLLVHDGQEIRASKRLYMTATPRIYAESAQVKAKEEDIYVASMDNKQQYGPQFHRLSFAEAVEADLLSDYKVTILAVSEKQIARDHQRLLSEGEALADVGRVIGCLNGLAKIDPEGVEFKDDSEPMHRAVAFSNTIKNSEHFVALVEREQDEAALAERNLAIEGKHVDGKSGVLERDRLLKWLREDMTMAQRCHVLSNARCLTEGIDVPALDAVLFLQPRKSQIDVVQAVGRVMRKAENKKYGYVILPVVVPSGNDPERALDRNDAYSHVWQVLQALRAHDERFDAYVNKLDLNRSNDGPISVIGVGDRGDNGAGAQNEIREATAEYVTQGILDFDLGELRTAIIAQIVKRCGERRYWEKWADSVTDIARRHDERIRALIEDPEGQVGMRFDEFVAALRHNLNDSITRDDAAAMLSQHLITKPVFDSLFGGQEFTERNPVSRVMQQMVDELEGYGLEAETAELSEFYASVRRRVEGIDNAEGKQRIVVELYERFFKVAYPKVAESLGIVYTPVEIVDFIIRSVQDLLRREFNVSLSDKGVHTLDPFVGTGTFIIRLLQSGFIDKDALLQKYASELHANEIMLLSYYIAAVNIETAYDEIAGEYQPFGGIVLTDTFQASEANDRADTTFFPRNNARIARQLGLDIRVIISNPPWSRGQGSHEDDNANQAYPTLDGKIARSYIAQSDSKGLKNPLYDSSVRAIRWASDRVLSGNGGIVGFVTNSGFLDGKSFDGFRKVLASEFHSIYIFDLRGNQRTSGETSQREGGKVFGSGSRAGVAVLLLVKRPAHVTEPASIYYHDIGDYLTRERKLETVGQVQFDDIEWTQVIPNKQGDWVDQRSDHFISLRPVAVIQSEDSIPSLTPLFKDSALGVITSRDAWIFNSSETKLRELVERQVVFYNRQVEALQDGADAFVRDPSQFKWDGTAEQRARRGVLAEVRLGGFRSTIYRPFFRQHFYMDRVLNNSVYQLPSIFPSPDTRNPTILVERGLRAPGRAPSVLAIDVVPDGVAGAGPSGRACQVLPRYTYVEPKDSSQSELLPVEPHRQDNISDNALEAYRRRYGEWATKDNIFSYVYGILHSPDYRARYASDLARMLPRIPEVSTADAFRTFSEAGQQLLDLHINYESADPYPLDERLSVGAPDGPDRYRVIKMRWGGTTKSPDHSMIVCNDYITLAGIPDEAHEYTVGPRSALAWLLDRYRVTTDKTSGIVNDPNDWGTEIGDPRYIIDLVKRITTVSVETMAIVRTLPSLEEAT